ncbi:MAG TPA: TRAP transporter TatT component family protein [Turneriella sp.]|nr:TRAP transporter TatT component family protein [Turneriella sp.]HNL53493.1 TRAP transporter TatT component family protein [Turneriella sp.]
MRNSLRAILAGSAIKAAVLVLVATSFTACSIKKIAVRQATGFFGESRKVFEQETDLELAEASIASNLKLLEAMRVHDPKNEELNLLIAEIYSVYTLSFVEDKMEQAEADGKDTEVARQRERAKQFYLRARDFAGQVLLPRLDVASMANLSEKELKDKLAKLDKDDIAPLFWYAFSWGSAINLDREDVASLSELPKIEIMMAQAKAWDESYYFGGAWLFEGVYFGARNEMMGGNPERSKAAFERNLKLTEGKMLITPYFYARTYCIFNQDKKCFDENLKRVLDAPGDIHPGQRLANVLAKKKAERLVKRRADFFVD